jgi:hypothetical protein
MGKTLGPAVVRSLAVTGNDPYLREGSDLTVIFHVSNRALFLGAVDSFIQQARKEFGKDLHESKADYHGVPVETFVTPLREVSLNRAVLGEFVIYSNSPTGLRRVLAAQQGRIKALADSLDFQYMRTVFRLEDKDEDGFAFLSDAFIRQLVGPASKIKEKRRLEALTSLTMVTNGALFDAWATGRLPADHEALLAFSGLKQREIYTPEGKGVTWDGLRTTAVSDVYNTLHFATPLVELPMDKVTPSEEEEYRRFREGYLQLWRRYFDPVGMRFFLDGERLRLETFILPLIRSSEYDGLRQWMGDGTTTLDTAAIPAQSLLYFKAHLSPQQRNPFGRDNTNKALGHWVMLRIDDNAVLGTLANLWIHQQLSQEWSPDIERDSIRLVFQVPWTVGVQIGRQKAFDATLKEAERYLGWNRGTVEDMKPDYQGVHIRRIIFDLNGGVGAEANKGLGRVAKFFKPVLYSAQVDKAWYLTSSLDVIHELADQAAARREGKKPPAATGETVPINSSLTLSPTAAVKARDVLRAYLEWESHRRALVNTPIWYPLYHSGLIAPDAPAAARRAAAMHYLGFVPVSPDGAAYVYDRQTDEVLNRRHGGLRRPTLQAGIEDSSPLGRMLEQIRAVRADLRFREDGIHTRVTIERKTASK